MINIFDQNNLFLKYFFDGYDFLQTEMGQLLIPSQFKCIILNHTHSRDYSNKKEFLEYCVNNFTQYSKITPYISTNLMKKYKVGLYNLTDWNDPENPWNNRDYILFNPVLEFIISKFPNLKNVQFWVCPSEDEIGFRILEPSNVYNAFKWLFMSGNNMIYGKDIVDKDKDCYIVEGFRDYVALRELGYNVIGLGSVEISKSQEEYINTLTNPILLFDNDNYGLKKLLLYKGKYSLATLINTSKKDAWDVYSSGEEIKICRIQ